MALRHFVRLLAWMAAAVGACTAGLQVRILGGLVGLTLVGLVLVLVTLYLPRTAHSAFVAGKFARAARRYWICGAVTWSPARDRAARLSRAGCALALGRGQAAERLLARMDLEALDTGERAVWLNNRACAALGEGGDAHGALALADQATALRPDVPGIQHTRALALLAVGRVDDALHVLDAMRAGGELAPRLEAQRCRELALAWDKKGESAYADDYRRRADVLGV